MKVPPVWASRARESDLPLSGFDLRAALVTAAGADIDYSANPLKGIEVCADGDVGIVYWEDATHVVMPCLKGKRIEGLIKTVKGTGTTTSVSLIGLR